MNPLRTAHRMLTRVRPVVARRRRLILGIVVGMPVALLVAAMFEAGVRARLDPRTFASPTTYYARPTVLAPDLPLGAAALDASLGRLGYTRVGRTTVATGEYYRGRRDWIIGRRPFRLGERLHEATTLVVRMDAGTGRIRSVRNAAGTSLDYATLEPERLRIGLPGTHPRDHVPVRLDQVPQHLVDAILTVEDRDFFAHEGIDLVRIAGAALANLRAGSIREGGSTITQQLAKNLFLSHRRTPMRKLRELFMAIRLEERYGKEELLSAYLNVIYLGHVDGTAIHGVGRAAQVYFGTDVSEIDPAQAALLAGMIRAPNRYTPARHPDRARDRRDLVLRLLHDRGLLEDAAYRRALDTPVNTPRQASGPADARYFTDYVTSELRAEHGGRVDDGALSVFTTLDARLQEAAVAAVRTELRRLERQYPALDRGASPLQAALVAVVPRTGDVLALVGGRDYGASQFNRAVSAQRQPGSAFKPIVALTALTADRMADGSAGPLTLASVLEDEPLAVETATGLWQPVNYDRRYRGAVSLREALERSLNVPFARVGLTVGPDAIVETARGLGITSRLQPVPSLALGASEVTPLEMARAYGVLAAGGIRAPLNPVFAVVGADGEILDQFDDRAVRSFSAAESYLVTSALLGAVEHGTGRGLRAAGYDGPFAAKSGTTNDFRDGWFIGYTQEIAVAVWVGFDDGRSLGLPGSRLALPILGRFLSLGFGEQGAGGFDRPWELEVVEIDPTSGLRAGWGCRGRPELFLPGTAPRASCSPWAAEPRSWSFERRSDARALLRDLLRRFEGEIR